MKALIIGATGATGTELVKELIDDSDFSEIHVFCRNAPNIKHNKLKIHIVDFNKPDVWKNEIQGDVSFSCLGTTLKNAGSKKNQYKVDFQYQYEFAIHSRENGIKKFVLVSSYGAKSKSMIFYSKIKGELEEEILKLNFENLYIFQPGLLNRNEFTRQNEILSLNFLNLFNKFKLFLKYRPLSTKTLAKALVKSAKEEKAGFFKLKLSEIENYTLN